MKSCRISLVGVAVMVGAFIWSLFPADSAVPNDANIGAGVLFIAGAAVVIAGLAHRHAAKSQPVPPAPRPTR